MVWFAIFRCMAASHTFTLFKGRGLINTFLGVIGEQDWRYKVIIKYDVKNTKNKIYLQIYVRIKKQSA